LEPYWWLTKDGDLDCLEMYERHYSAHQYKDGRMRKLFCGPGEKVCLRTNPFDSFFVWRKFIDNCIDERTGERQSGINCAAFRNEGKYLSSELIRQADAIADCLWTHRRHYTYVNPKKIRSGNPGFCFLAAGWRKAGFWCPFAKRWIGRYTKGGLLILERIRPIPARAGEPPVAVS